MKDEHTIAKKNAIFLESEINKLENNHWSWGEILYKDFWFHVKEINELFRKTKPLLKEDREKLWNQFGYICNKTKIKQSNETLKKKVKSESHYENIMSLISNSRVNTLFGFAPPDIEDMKELGKSLKEAGEMLSENKHEMLTNHKQKCFNEIREIRMEHDAWWKDLKKDKQHRKEDFNNRVRDNLDKNYERQRKATQHLERLKDHRDKLQNDIDSAWSDSFKDKACEWLSDTEDKICDIEQYIETLEGWISEDEAKLR